MRRWQPVRNGLTSQVAVSGGNRIEPGEYGRLRLVADTAEQGLIGIQPQLKQDDLRPGADSDARRQIRRLTCAG